MSSSLLLCGNGRVDPGEECDPSEFVAGSDSAECCTVDCRRLPEQTACSQGRGVCQSGRCATRQQQCASFNTVVMQTPNASVAGPFVPCAAQSTPTPLGTVLPPFLLAQSSCVSACLGTVISTLNGSSTATNGSALCVDFSSYSNLPPYAPDYVGCLQLASNPSNSTPSPVAGVCLSGTCRSDQCRAARCNNRGNCVLSDYSRRLLGVGSSIPLNSTVTTDMSLVGCSCDRGYFGRQCQFAGDADHMTCVDCLSPVAAGSVASSSNNMISRQQHTNDLVAAILGTFFGVLIVVAMVVLCCRRRRRRDQQEDFEHKRHAHKQSTATHNDDFEFGNASGARDDYNYYGRNHHGHYADNGHRHENDGTEQQHDTSYHHQHQHSYRQHSDTHGTLVRPSADTRETASDQELKENLGLYAAAVAASEQRDKKYASVNEARGSPVSISRRSDSLYSVGIDANDTSANVPTDTRLNNDLLHPPQSAASPRRGPSVAPPLPVLPVKLPASYLRAVHPYEARLGDEIDLMTNDLLYMIKSYDDGWGRALNLRSGKEGIFPLSFSRRVVVPPEGFGDTSQVTEQQAHHLEFEQQQRQLRELDQHLHQHAAGNISASQPQQQHQRQSEYSQQDSFE